MENQRVYLVGGPFDGYILMIDDFVYRFGQLSLPEKYTIEMEMMDVDWPGQVTYRKHFKFPRTWVYMEPEG